jgi:peptide/nickel transport system ATP-binding protein
MTTEPVLEVTDLRVTFADGTEAVRRTSFTVAPGEALAVVGESGAGKSTTALAIAALLPESTTVQGSIRLRGRELLTLTDRDLASIRGRHIAMIFQDPAFTPVHRIAAHVAEAVRDVPRREVPARMNELLRLAGLPDAERVARAYPHQLSGGQLRRAMIAIAMAADPSVVLADEPTAGLDPPVQTQILTTLQHLRHRTGAALVLITHDLALAAEYADRVLVMRDGHPIETAPTAQLLTTPSTHYTATLLRAVPTLARPSEPWRDHPTTLRDDHHPPTLDAVPTVDRPSAPRGDRATPQAPPTVDRPSVPWGDPATPQPAPIADHPPAPWTGHPATLHAAPIHDHPAVHGQPPASDHPQAIARRSGPDRSAALRSDHLAILPTSDDPPASGAAYREAIERAGSGPSSVRAAGVPPGRVWGRRNAPPVLVVESLVREYPGAGRVVDGISFDLRAGETLGLVGESGCGKTTTLREIATLRTGTVFGRDAATLSTRRRREQRRHLQLVFQNSAAALDPRMTIRATLAEPLRAFGRDRREIAARVPELLRLVGLDPAYAGRRPGVLSGGERQRVGIARALALEPRLVLLDEPFSALDVATQANIIALLRALKARLGLSYLIAAHDLAALRQLADRIAVMHQGRIVELGAADAVYETPAHPYTRLLLDAVPRLSRARPNPQAREHLGLLAGLDDRTSLSVHSSVSTRPDLDRDFRQHPGVADPPPPRPQVRSARPDSTTSSPGDTEGSAITAGTARTAQSPGGCRFRARCAVFAALAAHDRRRCAVDDPGVRPLGPDHAAACHFPLRGEPS